MELASLTLKQLKNLAAEKGINPAGDKRKKKTWLDAIAAQEELENAIADLSKEMDAYFDADTEAADLILIKEATQDGDRNIILGDWMNHPHYDMLMQQATQEIVESNNLWMELYQLHIQHGWEIAADWRELHNDTQILTIKDEDTGLWASLNARRRELGL